MAQSSLQVTQTAGGTFVRTATKSISAQTRHEEYQHIAEPDEATYTISFDGVSVATINTWPFIVHAGASLHVYIRRIWICQQGYSTSATTVAALRRNTTAASGGSSITPTPLDTVDSAAGATARTLPTAGTEGTTLFEWPWNFYATATTTTTMPPLLDVEFDGLRHKVPRIAAGTANGIGLKLLIAGGASNTVAGYVVITEAAY